MDWLDLSALGFTYTVDNTKGIQPDIIISVGITKTDIEKTLTPLSQRRIEYEAYQQQLKTAAEQGKTTEELQISTVAPDARAMAFISQ